MGREGGRSSENAERVLILGAGFAGLTIATELEPLAKAGKVSVTLVDRRGTFLMGLAAQGVLTGRRGPGERVRSYADVRARHATFVHEDVTGIDTQARTVRAGSRDIPYDVLVLALGVEAAPERVPGLAEAAHNLCEVTAMVRFKAALESIDRGTVLVLISRTPFKCPPAPYEYAFLIDGILRERGVRDHVRVVVTTPEPQPLPAAGPAVGDVVRSMMAQRGIEYYPNRKPTAVDAAGRSVTYEDGPTLGYTLLAAMPPQQAPKVVRDAGLADASGFVPAALGTFETALPNVYAVGDLAALKLPNGNPHPKAGVLAEAQALTVARGIAARLGAGRPSAYTGSGVCFIEDGRGQAARLELDFLAEGGPRATFVPPSEAGLAAKDRFERDRLEKWFEG